MAINLTSKPNVDPADSDFPYGNVKDNSGTNNGTPLNRLVLSDYIQFFHKLMDEAGISYNGVLDNDYSGWQFYEAFRKVTRPYKVMTGIINQSGTSAPTLTIYENTLEFTPVASRSGVGVYALTSVGDFAGNRWFMIGEGGSTQKQIRASINDDALQIFTADNSSPYSQDDDVLNNVSFEIRIYD